MTYFLIFLLISPILLWVFFYLLFNICEGVVSPITVPFWVIGALIDVFVNLTWGTVIFMQLPNIKRLFLSARMDDLIVNGSGYRKLLSIVIVGTLLEPYDLTGQHHTHGY